MQTAVKNTIYLFSCWKEVGESHIFCLIVDVFFRRNPYLIFFASVCRVFLAEQNHLSICECLMQSKMQILWLASVFDFISSDRLIAFAIPSFFKKRNRNIHLKRRSHYCVCFSTLSFFRFTSEIYIKNDFLKNVSNDSGLLAVLGFFFFFFFFCTFFLRRSLMASLWMTRHVYSSCEHVVEYNNEAQVFPRSKVLCVPSR